MTLLDKLTRRIALTQLQPIVRAVVRERLTYLSPAKLKRLEAAIERTRNVTGDLLEFGVALGGSGIILAHDTRPGRDFHGFDVFSMIPPPTSEKDDDKSKERYAAIKAGQSEGIGGEEYYGYRADLISDVKAAFARHGAPVDGARVRLHQGLFEDTWDAAGVQRIAFAHIDCDWYDPVRFCLESCAAKLSVGGLLLIDDYNDYGGCRAAVDEFLAAHQEYTFEAGANPILVRTC